MPPVEFEPTILAGERPQTYALDRAATGTGRKYIYPSKNVVKFRGVEKRNHNLTLLGLYTDNSTSFHE